MSGSLVRKGHSGCNATKSFLWFCFAHLRMDLATAAKVLAGWLSNGGKLSQARSVDRRGVMSQHTELAGPMPRFCRSALRIKIHSLLAWPSPN